MKTAVVVGPKGQDGRLATEYLEKSNYRVIGIGRGGPVNILSKSSVSSFLASTKPDEIYYLAAYHHASDEKLPDPEVLWKNSVDVQVTGLHNFLSSIDEQKLNCRLFYASSVLAFSDSSPSVITEETPPESDSVYGKSKIMGMELIRQFREKNGLFCCSGILGSHESPYRPDNFVSQKIVMAAVRAQKNPSERLILGDLNKENDWGAARDYVIAMHKMLQAKKPDDYLITGQLHKVKEFVRIAFAHLGLDWEKYTQEDSSLLTRKTASKIFSSQKIKKNLDWQPQTSFENMIREMVAAKGGDLVH